MDIASLTVKVVNEGLDDTVKGLGDLGKEAGKTEKASDKLSNSFKKIQDDVKKNTGLSRELKDAVAQLNGAYLDSEGRLHGADGKYLKMTDSMKKAINEVDGLKDALKREGKAAEDTGRKFKGLKGSTDGLTKGFSKLKSVVMGAFAGIGVASILQTANSMQELNNQIRVATGSAAEYAKAQSEIERIAMSNFASLDSVGELYASNSRALKTLNKTQEETLLFTENVTKAMRVSGGSAQSQAAAITQLGQAMASGVLRGDEFNSIAEQAPVFLELLGDKLSMTTGELRAFASEGGLTAEIVYDAISGASEKLDGLAGQTVTTMAQGIENVKTQWALLMDQFINAEGGVGELLAQGINQVALAMQGARDTVDDLKQRLDDFLQRADVMLIMQNATDALKGAWEKLQPAIEFVSDAVSTVIDFFKENEEITIALGTAIGVVAGAFLLVKGVIVVVTGVVALFGAAIALATSPVVLITGLLVALVAAGVYLYRNWDEIKAKAATIWESIKATISEKIEGIKNAISSKAQEAVAAFKSAFNSLPSPIKNILTIVYNVVKTQLDLVRNAFTTVLNMIKAAVRGDMQGVVDAFKTGMSNAWNIIKTGATNIVNAIKDLGSRLFRAGVDAVQGLINGIKSKIAGVKSAASELGQAAWGGVKSFLQIRSPSRKMAELGKNTAEGFAKGIKDNKKKAVSEAQKMAEQAVKAVKDTIANLKKEIALFGNDDPVAGLLWDKENTNKYFGVSDELFDKLVRLTEQKHKMAEADKANAAAMREFEQAVKDANATLAKQREEDAKRKANAAAGYTGISSDLMGLNNNPVQRLVDEYEHQLAVIYEYEQTHQDMLQESADKQLEIERMKQMAMRQLVLASGQIMAGDMSSIFKDMLGEQSAAYKAMFAIEKGFAIAQAGLAIQQNIANAMKYGFPQNLAFISGAIAQGAKLMGAIRSITMPVGQAHDGIMSVPKSGTWNLEKGERVLPAHTAKAMDKKLEQSGSGEVNITINVDAQGNSTMDAQNANQMSRQLANTIKAVVQGELRQERRQGGLFSGA